MVSVTLTIIAVLSTITLFDNYSSKRCPIRITGVAVRDRPGGVIILSTPATSVLVTANCSECVINEDSRISRRSVTITPDINSCRGPSASGVVGSNAGLIFTNRSVGRSTGGGLRSGNVRIIAVSRNSAPGRIRAGCIAVNGVYNNAGANTGGNRSACGRLLSGVGGCGRRIGGEGSNVLSAIYCLCARGSGLGVVADKACNSVLLNCAKTIGTTMGVDSGGISITALGVTGPGFVFCTSGTALSGVGNSAALTDLNTIGANGVLRISLRRVSEPNGATLRTLRGVICFVCPSLGPGSTASAAGTRSTATSGASTAATARTAAATDSSGSITSGCGLAVASSLSLGRRSRGSAMGTVRLHLCGVNCVTSGSGIANCCNRMATRTIGGFRGGGNLGRANATSGTALMLLFSDSTGGTGWFGLGFRG